MLKINNGGSAFPTHAPISNGLSGEEWEMVSWENGMTLRQYYAAKAMQVMAIDYVNEDKSLDPDFIAKKSFELADAMIKAEMDL